MPLSGVGDVAFLTTTRSISLGVMVTRASSQSFSALPKSSDASAQTTLTCSVPAVPGDGLRELAARELTRAEVDRHVEAPVAARVVEVAELVVDHVRDRERSHSTCS